jgi:FlaA1/EpsC-like NDP-sugar epimerase
VSLIPHFRQALLRLGSNQLVRYSAILSFDVLATVLSLYSAVFLRFEGQIPFRYAELVAHALPILVGMRLALVFLARLHRWSFRMSGLSEAMRLAFAMLVATCLFVVAFYIGHGATLPRSVVALEFFFTTSLMASLRFAPRIGQSWYAEQLRSRRNGSRRTLIVGAGGAADLLARDLLRSSEHEYQLIGFVDDDPAKVGSFIDGRRVLGRIADLPNLIERHQISMVMLAITNLAADRIREILTLCSSQKASFKIIPASLTHMSDRVSAAMLHDLSPEDLLPRDQVEFDRDEIGKLVAGRRILVTGAAGSIGGEIARQVAEHGAGLLALVDMNENELYLGVRRLRVQYPETEICAEVADIRDPARLRRLGSQYRPEYVFHAAAHKHVPLMEDAPEEAIKNNVFGTQNVARMAEACGAERLVFISTDKAVKPTSVMGASKRVAEMLVRDMAHTSKTRMTAVRFGNVLGSAGSVVPLFKQQIEQGGPVTVTHPECTRYFMTIPEAVGLVLLAGLGGYGDLCVLDMGQAIRIADLAAHLITMAGYVPGREIPIVYTGLRPGEKLFEELLTEEEEKTQAVRNRIMVASPPPPPQDLAHRLEDLRRLADGGDREGIIRMLRAIVPSYRWTPGTAPEPLQTPAEGVEVLPDRAGGGEQQAVI